VADQWVNGYFRKVGTYVQGYWRSEPDQKYWNNWSSWGNTNPYTGKKGYDLPKAEEYDKNPSYYDYQYRPPNYSQGSRVQSSPLYDYTPSYQTQSYPQYNYTPSYQYQSKPLNSYPSTGSSYQLPYPSYDDDNSGSDENYDVSPYDIGTPSNTYELDYDDGYGTGDDE
jgi:hypothetical protein